MIMSEKRNRELARKQENKAVPGNEKRFGTGFGTGFFR